MIQDPGCSEDKGVSRAQDYQRGRQCQARVCNSVQGKVDALFRDPPKQGRSAAECFPRGRRVDRQRVMFPKAFQVRVNREKPSATQ